MNSLLYLCILLCFTSFSVSRDAVEETHPIYVSLALVDHNPQEETLDISLKMFTDDLQAAIRKHAKRDDLYVGYEKEIPAVDSIIHRYVNDQVQFLPNNVTEPQTMSYLGKEIELDVTWCYFRIADVSDLKQLTTHCELFTELFPSQTTIMHVKRKGKEKSMLFKRGKTFQNVIFSDD
ncbi:MAG: DUF6702 family protein [Bacteroidota bacterium]